MGQNERNAKSGTSVESCSLLLQTSLHFTTDIFSAKSRVRICKHSVNERQQSVIRRWDFSCFYGIAAAAELRRTIGNIANTIGNIDRWDFLFSTLTTISKTLFGHFCKQSVWDKSYCPLLTTTTVKRGRFGKRSENFLIFLVCSLQQSGGVLCQRFLKMGAKKQ